MAVNTASEKFTISEYAKGLMEEPRKRYEEKLRLISCLDPFLLPNMGSTSVATPANHSTSCGSQRHCGLPCVAD